MINFTKTTWKANEIRKAPAASGIYLITNIMNNKRYVGQSKNIRHRWSQHPSLGCTLLKRAFEKYGRDNFEFSVLEFCPADVKILSEREQFWIDNINPEYNLAPVAGSCLGIKRSLETRAKISTNAIGRKVSEETRAKISAATRGANNPFYKKSHSLESRKKISAKAIGRKVSEETRAKISAVGKGRKVTDKTKAKQRLSKLGNNNPNYGRKFSKKFRMKIARANSLRQFSPIQKERMKRADERAKELQLDLFTIP